MWTVTTEADEYVEFLRRLLSAIAGSEHLRDVSEVRPPCISLSARRGAHPLSLSVNAF